MPIKVFNPHLSSAGQDDLGEGRRGLGDVSGRLLPTKIVATERREGVAKKRGQDEGSIYNRPDGRWTGVINLRFQSESL
jgi:hypothetical protein